MNEINGVTGIDVFEGHCQCGAVSYRVTGQSIALFACHCLECQKQSSSAFGMALWIREPKVQIQSGRLRSWVRITPGGREMVCQFCPTCGSRIFHQMADQEDVISIKPGTLDDPGLLEPVAHLWTKRARSWITFNDCLVYPDNPINFGPIFEAWSASKGIER